MDTMDEKAEFEKPRRSRLAVVSLILGLLSILLPIPVVGLLHPLVLPELLARDLFWLMPFAALVVGTIALYRIRQTKGILKGKICASIGLLLAVLPAFASPYVIIEDISIYAKSEVMTIDNVTKKTEILPSHKDPQTNVNGPQLYISGYIDGSAAISIGEDENSEREYKIPSGNVRFKFRTEGYNNECLIKYKPTTVNSGHLKIRYYFDTF